MVVLIIVGFVILSVVGQIFAVDRRSVSKYKMTPLQIELTPVFIVSEILITYHRYAFGWLGYFVVAWICDMQDDKQLSTMMP